MSAFHIFATAINLKPNHAESYMLLGGKYSFHLKLLTRIHPLSTNIRTVYSTNVHRDSWSDPQLRDNLMGFGLSLCNLHTWPTPLPRSSVSGRVERQEECDGGDGESCGTARCREISPYLFELCHLLLSKQGLRAQPGECPAICGTSGHGQCPNVHHERDKECKKFSHSYIEFNCVDGWTEINLSILN